MAINQLLQILCPFPNRIAEKAICNLQENARKQLLHLMTRWPRATRIFLWPYTLHYAACLHHNLPTLQDNISRLKKFSGVDIGFHLHHFHTFGCPVYALDISLASGKSIPKWSLRAWIDLDLGPSPFNAQKVNLVLNLSTEVVSPQYHCKYNDFFETSWYNQLNLVAVIM